MGRVADAMASLDKDAFLTEVNEALKSGTDALAIVEDARKGLERVGAEYEKGKFFLMELMWASQIFKDALAILGPNIKEKPGTSAAKGRIVMGTVKGDIHDLGKSLVRDLLECSGYEVADLGVDVPSSAFVKMIGEIEPQVVGLSALLTAAIAQASETIGEIEVAGQRESIKMIMGGGVVGEINAGEFGLDYATTNASEGIRVIEKWIAEAR